MEQAIQNIVIPGPSTGYTDLIDQAMEKIEAVESQENRFPLRPSAAGYCARRLAYSLMNFRGKANYPNEIKDPETKRLLNLGSSVEWHSIKNFELIKTVVPDMKVRYKQQVVTLFRLDPVPSGAVPELIEGSLDLTLIMTNTGGLGDVKSRKDKFSAAFKTEWDQQLDKFGQMKSLVPLSGTAWYAPNLLDFLDELGDPFFSDNFVQTNEYLCTDWAKEHGIDHGFIYRYNKNDSRHLEIRFAPSQELYDFVRAKFNGINQAVDQGRPEDVEKEYVLGSSRCAFCPFSKQCWGDVNSLKEYFKTWPKKQWPTDIQDDGPGGLLADFNEYEVLAHQSEQRDRFEQMIVKTMEAQKLQKVRLPNGHIYELKLLKSPRPHFELRRGKL